jgi:addiction module RelE/StbE family toxin
MTVRWTRLALDDLDQAREFISADKPAAARATIDRIESAVRALESHPHIGKKGRVEGTRELVISGTPFVVAYRIAKRRVEILGLIHGARRWPEAF